MRTLRSRLQVALCAIGMIILAAVGASAVSPLHLTGVLYVAVAELFIWRAGIWPAVIITEDLLIVKGAFRTSRMPWGDIEEIGVDTMLRITLRNGKSVGSIAFTRQNYNLWLHREGLVGRIARELEDIRKSKTGA